MKHIILILVFVSIKSSIYGQNLIPNHSFEKVNVVDSFFSRSYVSFNNEISDWTSPTQSSPDIIHEPYIETMCMEGTNFIRKNFFIKPLKPKTGRKFAGIKVYGCVRANTHCREYLQVKTLETLKKGNCYAFSYYTNPLTNGSRINNMGVAFSSAKVNDIEQEEVLDLGNRFGVEDIVKPGPGKWQEITGIITATEDWNYMIIGNFFHDFETMEISNKGGYPWGYYLVDEVSLYEVDCGSRKRKIQNAPILIYFESNKFELRKTQQNQLTELWNKLKGDNFKQLSIFGHADEVGNEDFNQKLSLKRANSVRDYLINLGMLSDKISVTGYGESKSVSKSDKRENRRVEIHMEY